MKGTLVHTVAQARTQLQRQAKQERFALARALNNTGFDVQRAEKRAMQSVFVGVTPYVLNSVRVSKATPDRMECTVDVDFWGRGKGVPAESVLQAEVYGGRRRAKRAESAFQRIGLLPRGWAMVPGPAAPRDAYGNVPGAFYVRLISYFAAFGEQGYRANMTDKKRARLAKRARTERGFSTINGVEYFASRGKGEYSGRGAWRNGRQQHLHAGIWQRSGIHGSDLKLVMLFVPLPAYRVRLQFQLVARNAAEQVFGGHLDRSRASAWATAR
jgi:hypothetical protein